MSSNFFKGGFSVAGCVPEVLELLALLHEHVDRHAIIGGGFLRDLRIHDKQGKDIDAFVHYDAPIEVFAEKVYELTSLMGIGYSQLYMFTDRVTLPGWDTCALLKFEFLGQDIDLMFIDKPVSGLWYLARVNFGVNQIWCDGVRFFEGTAFKRDNEDQTITLINSATQREVARNLKKADDLLARLEWQDWRFVCALTDAEIDSLPTGKIPSKDHA